MLASWTPQNPTMLAESSTKPLVLPFFAFVKIGKTNVRSFLLPRSLEACLSRVWCLLFCAPFFGNSPHVAHACRRQSIRWRGERFSFKGLERTEVGQRTTSRAIRGFITNDLEHLEYLILTATARLGKKQFATLSSRQPNLTAPSGHCTQPAIDWKRQGSSRRG